MAKKRPASRPSSSSGGTKKKVTKPTKKAPTKAPRFFAKKPRTGLENPKQVDFNPLKKQIRAHIDRLSKVKEPSDAIAGALRSLRQVTQELSNQCSPTMNLPLP